MKKIAVVMGSQSDWETLKETSNLLKEFNLSHECFVVSAHRTPEWLFDFAFTAKDKGFSLIIAGAGGAAHLPGMVASLTSLPVLGVPVESRTLKGLDSLLSIAQMPSGVPVASFAIGVAGAKNAALFAARILGLADPKIQTKVNSFMKKQTQKVLKEKKITSFKGKP